jgi:hypothetical protein
VVGEEKDCKLEAGPKFYEVKFGPNMTITPFMTNRLEIRDGATEVQVSKVGLAISATFLATIRLQSGFQAKMSCPMLDLGTTFLNPPGFLSAIFTASFARELKFILEGKIEGGPKLEVGITCEVKAKLAVGWETIGGVSHYTGDWEPPKPVCKPVFSVFAPQTEEIPPVFVELTASAPVEAPISITLFGRVAKFFGWLFRNPKLGEFEIITGQVGPRLKVSWENEANVRANSQAKAKGNFELFATIKPNTATLDHINSLFGLPKGISSITLFEITEGILTFYQPVNSTSITAQVGSGAKKPATRTIFVQEGDSLEIVSNVDVAPGVMILPRPGLTGATLFERQGIAGTSWVKSDVFVPQVSQSSPVPTRITITVPSITEAQCAELSAPVEFQLIAEQTDFRPAFGGTFFVKCVEGKMRLDPDKIDEDGDVQLISSGTRESTWQATTIPDWLTINPFMGTFEESPENETSTTLQVALRQKPTECIAKRTGTIILTSENRGDAEVQYTQDNPCYIRFEPSKITGPGIVQTTVATGGLTDDEFQIDQSQLPHWLTVDPNEKVALPATDTRFTVTFNIEARLKLCRRQPARIAFIELKTTSRGPARLTVIDPAVEIRPGCRKTSGSWKGDPHMTSMDGVGFEGQILGEYVSARSLPGDELPFEVVARTQPTSGATGSVAPTSVTAVAFTIDGHTVEAYRTLDDTGVVLIDGVLTPLTIGIPVEVTTNLSVTRTASDRVMIDSPAMQLGLFFYYGGIIDLDVVATVDTPMEGLLGSPDGVPENDFVDADSGAQYLVSHITSNKVPEFFDFVDSWRIHDRADSPFTRGAPEYPDSEFHAGNPGFNQVLFDEWGPQVDAAVVGVEDICDGSPSDSLQTKYAMALELSLGRGDVLERYICSYGVIGVATSNGLPTAGLEITVDGHGLDPCVTRSGADGRYLCIMNPDLAEVRATTPTFPLQAAITGRWPGVIGGPPAASATASYATRAGHDDGPLYSTVDLAIDPNSLPTLVLGGVITRDGEPVAGLQAFQVDAFDSANVLIARSTEYAVVDSDLGSYSFSRVLPPTAVKATIRTTVAGPLAETFSVDLTGLTAGVDNRTWNIEYAVPTLAISGAMANGAGSGLAPQFLTVFSTNAAGGPLPTQTIAVTPAAADGSYGPVFVALPRAAASAKVRTSIAPYFENYETAFAPVLPGTNPVTFSFVHNPPTLTVTGTMKNQDGTVVTAPVTLQLNFYDAAGGFVNQQSFGVTPAAGTGAYEIPVVARLNARKVTAAAYVGVQSDSYFSPEHPIVPGTNTMTFDVVHQILTLTVSGTMKKEDGSALDTQVPVVVRFFDSANVALNSINTNVTPAAGSGTYSFTVAGQRTAVRATVTATAGVANETFTVQAVSLAVGAANAVTLDVQLATVVLAVSGNMTRVSGEGLVGPINARVTFRNAANQGLNVVWQTVNPTTTGAYSYTVNGHRDATSALVEVFLGIHSDVESTVLTDLTTGSTNQRTFDVAYNPPVAQLSGRMTGPDGLQIAREVTVRFRSRTAAGGVPSDSFHTTLLDAEGDYAMNITLPRAATSVDLTAHIGAYTSDWVTKSAAVAPGGSPITLNIDYRPPTALIKGTMTGANGQSLGGTRAISIFSYDRNGNGMFGFARSVQPDPTTGAYELSVTLPWHAGSIELAAQIGSESSEWFRTTAGGITEGEHVVVPLDVQYNPAKLHVVGTALVDDLPAANSVKLRVVTHTASTTFERYFTASTDSTGAYDTTITLSRFAAGVEVSAMAYEGANEYNSGDDDAPLTAGELRQIRIDIDDHPSALNVSGVLKLNNEVVDNATLYLFPMDADDNVIQRPAFYGGFAGHFDAAAVEVDPATGEYSTTFKLPNHAVRIEIAANLDGQGGFSQHYPIADATVDNNVTFIVDQKVVRVTGTMLDHFGAPVEDLFNFEIEVTEHGPNGDITGGTTTAEYYPHFGPNGGDGEFEFEYIVQHDTTSVTFDVNEQRLGFPQLFVDDLDPGLNERTWIHEISAYKVVMLDGTITDGGVPIPDCVAEDEDCVIVRFEFVDFDQGSYPSDPPYDVVIDTQQMELDVTDGHWQINLGVPYDATLGRIGVFPPGFDPDNDEPFTQAYLIGEGIEDYDADAFDVDIATTRITFDGSVSYNQPDCTAGPFILRLEIWGWDSRPADESPSPEDIPGGTLGGEYLVMPDEDGTFSLVTHLPPSTTWVRIYNDHGDIYPAGFGGGGARGFSIPANSFIGTGLGVAADCPPPVQ